MKQRYFLNLLVWIACLVMPSPTLAQGTAPVTAMPNGAIAVTDSTRLLFTQDSLVAFTLTANLRAIMKDRGEQPVAHRALLTYTDNQQQAVSLPLTMKVRGNFRRSRVNCAFPPLLIDLPKKKARNTLFAHQNKLKLVTHCQEDEWVIREYMVYKLYNLLTNLSFRAQLARVTYADSLSKRASEVHWAFLLEDESDLAKRNGVTLVNMKQTTMSYADSLSMATVAVFEYMIGNTDWSVPFLHNIRLFSNGRTSALPVPYDFDHSGIVEAAYAKPAEQLEIATVRQRLYRGVAYPMPVLQQVFDKFRQAKPQFYALYQTNSRLDKVYIRRTLRYLDEFYTLINNPALARVVFSQNAQSGVIVKGLK